MTIRTGFLVTARLKSERLPKKIVKDLNGKTVIERIIDRIKQIKKISPIVICTSELPQDDELVRIAERNKIKHFRGDAEDVLARLLAAAKHFQLDYFLGITADNPLINVEYSDQIVKLVQENKWDFIKVEGLPLGAATYAIRTRALETVCRIKSIIDTEIWGPLIDRPDIFAVKVLQAQGKAHRPKLRFTLDYQEDYEFINRLYTQIPFHGVLNFDHIMDFLDEHPEMIDINKHCYQRELSQDTVDQIDRMFRSKKDEILSLKKRIYDEALS